MARAAVAVLIHSLLLLRWSQTAAAATHHLLLKFTVKSQSRPLQPWCEVLGSVDEQHVLKYDSNSNKVKPLNKLINKLNGTKNWTELTQTLGDIGRELRIILLDINGTEISTDGHPTLQARIICQHEGEQCIGAFCQFGINTKIFFQFDAMNNIWNVTDPVASGIKHKWEHDRELGNFLRRTSMGDCSHWLKTFLKELYDPMSLVMKTSPISPVITTHHPSGQLKPSSTHNLPSKSPAAIYSPLILVISCVFSGLHLLS